MNEPKPNWYKALQEDPLHKHSFSKELAVRIKDEAIRTSNTRIGWIPWIAAGVVTLALIGFILGRLYDNSENVMKPIVLLDVNPTVLMTIQPSLSPSPTPAPTFRPTPQPMFNGRYLVHNGYYYDMTDAVIPLDQIGDQLGTVSRIGDWAMKKEWDTNQFTPNSKIYAIKGENTAEKLAVRSQVRSPKNKESSYDYLELKRATAVEAFDSSILLNAKGDKEEVSIAMSNIRKVDPFLYEFSDLSTSIELQSVSFADQYTEDASILGLSLSYIYPLADDTAVQGYIQVSEYEEKMKLANSSIFANRIEIIKEGDKIHRTEKAIDEADLKVLREFDTDEFHWKDYGNQTYVAKKNDHYYEIQLQGTLSDEQLMDLLNHLHQASLAK